MSKSRVGARSEKIRFSKNGPLETTKRGGVRKLWGRDPSNRKKSLFQTPRKNRRV